MRLSNRIWSATLVGVTAASAVVTLVATAAQASQVIWAHMGQESPAYVQILQNYQKKSGNTVKMIFCATTSDLTNALMDSPPDLISMNPSQMTDYVEMGIFADMSKELAGAKGLLADLIPSTVKEYSSGKRIYALPWSAQVTAMRYNTTLFKAAGLPLPTASWKYTGEYYAAARKLTKDVNGDRKTDQWGLVGIPIADWTPLIYSFGAKFVSDDGKKFMFTGKEAVQSLDFIKKLHKEGLAEPFDWQSRDDNTPMPFVDGKAGTMISNWAVSSNDVKFKVGMCVPPSGPKGSYTAVDAAGIGVFTKSKKKKAAVDFARYLVSTDSQIELFKKDGIMPTSLSALQSRELNDSKTSIDRSLLKALPKAKAMSANPALRRSFGLNRGLGDYINGDLTATDFIAQIRDRVEQALANSTW